MFGCWDLRKKCERKKREENSEGKKKMKENKK